jgi:hypothetical protein
MSVKLQTGQTISRNASSSSLIGGAAGAAWACCSASACCFEDVDDAARAAVFRMMCFWSRVVPVTTTVLSLLASSLSRGSTGVKPKDRFHVSTTSATAGISRFSTCNVDST